MRALSGEELVDGVVGFEDVIGKKCLWSEGGMVGVLG